MSGNTDLDVRTPQPIPPATVPIADMKTGMMNPPWQRFMRLVWQRTGMAGGAFPGLPKVSTWAIPSTGAGSFGSTPVLFSTPFPNYAEYVIVSSDNASLLVAAKNLTLVGFDLVWQNTFTGGAIAGNATWSVWGG